MQAAPDQLTQQAAESKGIKLLQAMKWVGSLRRHPPSLGSVQTTQRGSQVTTVAYLKQ